MKSRSIALWALALSFAAFSCVTYADTSEQDASAFALGKSLLTDGKFGEALQAFSQAAKENPDNQKYRQYAIVLRQVIKMRAQLEKETDQDKWLSTARGLHRFYNSQELYSESLILDKKTHEMLNTTESAVQLAHTYLALDKTVEAESLLTSIEKDAPVGAQVLLGIIKARLNKTNEAVAIAQKCKLDGKTDSSVAYNLACLQALTGNKEAALKSLTHSFKNTRPSMLDKSKEMAQKDKDLTSITGTKEFAKVLKTESVIKESGCSGGTSCGKCPNRTKCGSDSGAKKCGSKTEKK